MAVPDTKLWVLEELLDMTTLPEDVVSNLFPLLLPPDRSQLPPVLSARISLYSVRYYVDHHTSFDNALLNTLSSLTQLASSPDLGDIGDPGRLRPPRALMLEVRTAALNRPRPRGAGLRCATAHRRRRLVCHVLTGPHGSSRLPYPAPGRHA
jgi:hypothetical protein